MLDGLHSYEKLLAVLGTALFVILALGLFLYVYQRRNLITLLPFFLLPVVMIGFPGIQKVSYEDGKVELERALARVEQNPSDSAARSQLQATVNKIAPRAATDPETSLKVARAFAKLDQPQRALNSIEPALEARPTQFEAKQLRDDLLRRNPTLRPIAPDRATLR